MYGARNNFHGVVDHPTSTNNGSYPTNGCNGNINGTRFNQHVPAISRTANPQNDHHRHQPHAGELESTNRHWRIANLTYLFV